MVAPARRRASSKISGFMPSTPSLPSLPPCACASPCRRCPVRRLAAHDPRDIALDAVADHESRAVGIGEEDDAPLLGELSQKGLLFLVVEHGEAAELHDDASTTCESVFLSYRPSTTMTSFTFGFAIDSLPLCKAHQQQLELTLAVDSLFTLHALVEPLAHEKALAAPLARRFARRLHQ